MTQLQNDVGQMAFEKIGFQAAHILNRLRNARLLSEENQKHEREDGNAEDQQGKRPEQHPDERRRYVEQRLKDWAAFEQRYKKGSRS